VVVRARPREAAGVKNSPIKTGAKSLERGSTFAADRKPLKRTAPQAGEGKQRRRSTLNPGRGFAASPEQRAKVALHVCAVIECGVEHCDPAHLAPRALGRGCDDAACVIALCRPHHEQFDHGDLDLLPHIAGRGFETELAHMQTHYSDPLSVVFRLSGHRWVPEPPRIQGGAA
jgi:hypothetical protein